MNGGGPELEGEGPPHERIGGGNSEEDKDRRKVVGEQKPKRSDLESITVDRKWDDDDEEEWEREIADAFGLGGESREAAKEGEEEEVEEAKTGDRMKKKETRRKSKKSRRKAGGDDGDDDLKNDDATNNMRPKQRNMDQNAHIKNTRT